MIIVGLPGDQERATRFDATVRKWCTWLTGPLGFASADVHVLSGTKAQAGSSRRPATREAVARTVAQLRKTLRPSDRFWVFFLGHANYDDDEHAWLHLPGPDLNEKEFGKLFAGIDCREQVFWMTSSESGRFLRALSAKGRIVITATRTKGEVNETEFPEALAAVAERPFASLDVSKSGEVPVILMYYLVLGEVQARYNSDNRAPAEHSLLDDNGDGRGTERPLTEAADRASPTADGLLAYRVLLPYAKPPTIKKPAGAELK